MVTIKDVAKRAQVSVSTVSHALNSNRPVKEETRERILKAIEELGYEPNKSAQILRSGSSRTIGLVMAANIHTYSDPFFAVFTSMLADTLVGSNYDLLLSHSMHEIFEEARYEKLIQNGQVDGFIVLDPMLADQRLTFLSKRDIPFVVLGRSEEFPDCPHIDMDNVHGTFIATEHLIDMGHSTIGFIGFPLDLAFSFDRHKGYQMALERHGLTASESHVVTGAGSSSEAGYWEVLELLERSPGLTAVVCADDRLAFNAIRALRERDFDVPRDMSVVGYTDVQAARSFAPPLTTVRQPVETMAELVGKRILAILEPSYGPVDNCVLKPTLIRRGSVAMNRIKANEKGVVVGKA